MDLQVVGLEDLESRIRDAVDRIGELQTGTQVQSEVFFSPQFMRNHTEFESFDTFCAQSPLALDDASDLEGAPRDQLNEYIAVTTAFETWEEMKTRAAEEAIIDHVVS
ncbi:hypothetical protein [Halarchaeum nitratireducens]|uniref:Uncharacterized protein n=1 Tax=Halarchaeum nitratireducens TaxID=489913 RepID=A0A830GBG5_9EURY|nr:MULTISPECIES: hypothetical protein [Halarchaeum]MBP2252078.1 hypothetical protein [Halarchaeum solikamskense]GGN16792.1 hypothetical protein GCM10009021_16820 [Halarchaeum nitratireducens]